MILRRLGHASHLGHFGQQLRQEFGFFQLLESASREIDLAACPAWVFANAGGTGYYRTSWTSAQLAALPLEMLTPAERLTLAYDLKASKNPDAKPLLVRLAADPQPEIAAAARETPLK